MKSTISTLALVLGLTYAGSVRADYSPEYELGVFGGGHLWNPGSGVGRTSSAEDNQVAHGGLFGIRVGIGLHPRFMLEAELIRQGGIAEVAAPFAAKVVADMPLITGQNPASAIPVAEAVISQLRHLSRQQVA